MGTDGQAQESKLRKTAPLSVCHRPAPGSASREWGTRFRRRLSRSPSLLLEAPRMARRSRDQVRGRPCRRRLLPLPSRPLLRTHERVGERAWTRETRRESERAGLAAVLRSVVPPGCRLILALPVLTAAAFLALCAQARSQLAFDGPTAARRRTSAARSRTGRRCRCTGSRWARRASGSRCST